MHNIVP